MDNSPKDTSPGDTPLWVDSARHFIGTDDESFLADAMKQCDDAAARAVLEKLVGTREREGVFFEELPGLINDLLTSLLAQSRRREAVMIELLMRRSSVRLATLNIHAKASFSGEVQSQINFFFNRGIELSRIEHLEECEAYFAKMLGDYEQSLGNWEAACGAHGYSVGLYSKVIQQIGDAASLDQTLLRAYLQAGLAALLSAAISNGEAGHEKLAFNLLENTMDLYRTLSTLGGIRRGMALGVHGAFSEFDRLRQPRAARILGDITLTMYRDLYEADPGQQQAYDLAIGANDIGQFYARLGDLQKALTLCSEGVHLLEGLVEKHPWFFQGPLGIAYNALAQVHRLAGRQEQALSYFEQSVTWIRRASAQQDDPNRITNRSYLVEALNNYGSACRDAGNKEQAIKAYEEAVALLDDLRATTPYVAPKEWMTYGNLCLLLASEGRLEEAGPYGERAMALLEADRRPAHEAWLEKGLATSLYLYMFESYVSTGKAEWAFRCLLALRTPGWALNNEEESNALGDSLRRVEMLGRERGRPIAIICPQTLLDSRMMIAVLRSDAVSIEFVDCSAFVGPASDLLEQVFITRSTEDDGLDHAAICAAAAERAWAALPTAIQGLLSPRDGRQTLICGDDSWMSFPWEVLKLGPFSHDFLGLKQSLPRWPSPDASSLAAMESKIIDGFSSEFAVVCPWNATSVALESARREAVVVSGILKSHAKPGASGVLLLGEDATGEAMAGIVMKAPDIIHYAGHGSVADDEEALLLYNADQQPTLFGRRELRAALLESAASPDVEESRARLVVLNCCYGGRNRSFGGHREDLASVFLSSGVSAVIASAIPVIDQSAGILGVCLHHRFVAEEEPIADVVVRARRLVARCMQLLGRSSCVAWCTIVYHGNPFLVYRRSQSSPESEGNNIESNIAVDLANVVTSVRSRQLLIKQAFEEILHDEINSADSGD